MNKISIVIVDDHKMFLEGIISVMSDHEAYEILRSFEDANKALQFLSKNEVDLLITDVSMPKMNGLELVKRVRSDSPRIKILAISMFEQIQYFEGINGYILKESGTEELLKAIRTIIIDGKDYFYSNYDKNKRGSLEFNKNILTRREQEIIKLIAKQYSVDEIAEELFLSRHTIETHKKNIFQKLQVNNAAGLIKKALYLGYL